MTAARTGNIGTAECQDYLGVTARELCDHGGGPGCADADTGPTGAHSGANASAEFAMIEMTPGLAQAIADCPNCQAGGTDAPERSTVDERWSANLRAVCAVLRSRYRTDTWPAW